MYSRKSGSQKVFHYVDLRLLATLAEEAGVDLRALYLKRSANLDNCSSPLPQVS